MSYSYKESLQNKLEINRHSFTTFLYYGFNKMKTVLVIILKLKLVLHCVRPPRPEQQQPDQEVSGKSADGAAGLRTEDLSRWHLQVCTLIFVLFTSLLLHLSLPYMICFLWLDVQTGANPDASASAASDELQHNGRTLLHRTNWKRSHRQHHPLHPENGDCRLQQPNHWSHRMTPEQTVPSSRCRLKSYNLSSCKTMQNIGPSPSSSSSSFSHVSSISFS